MTRVLRLWRKWRRAACIFYGVEKPAEFAAEEIEDRGALGTSFTLLHRGKRTRMELPLPGRHVVWNALAAIAAASVWNIGAAEAQAVLRGLQTPAMRGELIRFTNGFGVDQRFATTLARRRCRR